MSQPERSCAVCRQRFPQAELTRWVVVDGSAVRDTSHRQSGRGYYSCASCIARAPQVIAGRHQGRLHQLKRKGGA